MVAAMARTGVVIDSRYLDHDTGPAHPERAERIAVLLPLVEARAGTITRVPARPATGDELALVHDPAHIEEVAATEHKAGFAFDADTPTSPATYAIAMVRPPGHHAERDRAMGFCYFNNAAVGAQYLRRRHGLQRILIVDWDLHHGNGTQHIFEDDPGVLYVSTHQYPYYPGTGAIGEVGHGAGEGFTVNLAFPAGFGDAEYSEAFHAVIVPSARQYDPQFVLISAGFDAHVRDPLGGMAVTEAGFSTMARILLDIARDHSHGRCAAVLEGGYDLPAIRNSVACVLAEFQGVDAPLPAASAPSRAG